MNETDDFKNPLFGYKAAAGYLATRGIHVSWTTLKKLVLRHVSPISYVGRHGHDRVFEAATLYHEYIAWIRSRHEVFTQSVSEKARFDLLSAD